MIAILDGDELAYKVGYGSQHTWYNILDQNRKQLGRFKSAVEAKEWMGGDSEGLIVEKEIDILPERVAIRNASSTIKSLLDLLNTREFILCFSSPINFRNEIATLQDYKSNRSEDSKPFHLSTIKKFMMDKYESNVVEGYEADDLLAIYYNDIDPNKEMKAVIVTQDKDLLQVPAYFLNLGTERQSEYGNAGEIFCIHPAVGLANFYKQLISGDSTDTIPGIYSITGTRNSKKFAEYIQPGVDEETMYVKVRSLYYEAIGSKEDFTKRIDLDCILWEIGNLLYMRRSFDDTGWEIPV